MVPGTSIVFRASKVSKTMCRWRSTFPGSPNMLPRPNLTRNARRLDLRHTLGFVPHGDRAKTGFLRSALNQTDGLMAFGSDRDQKEDVDRGCLQLL